MQEGFLSTGGSSCIIRAVIRSWPGALAGSNFLITCLSLKRWAVELWRGILCGWRACFPLLGRGWRNGGYKPRLGGSRRAWLCYCRFWPMGPEVWCFSILGEPAGSAFVLILLVSILSDPSCFERRHMSWSFRFSGCGVISLVCWLHCWKSSGPQGHGFSAMLLLPFASMRLGI